MNRTLASRLLPLLATALVLVGLFAAAGATYDHFLSLRVVLNLFKDRAFLGVVAVGMTFVILSGGIDLSVGSVVCLAGIVLGVVMNAGWLVFGIGLAMHAKIFSPAPSVKPLREATASSACASATFRPTSMTTPPAT